MKASGDTFPETPEEIKIVEDLIVRAEYDKLLELCEGKNLDFNVNSTIGRNVPLMYRTLEQNSRNRDQSVIDRKNKILEFMLKNGGAAVLRTEMGVGCVAEAAAKNNKAAFDLFLKNGFDLNQKGTNGKTVLESLVERNTSADPEIMGKLKATTKPSLFVLVQKGNADELKKALEDKENLAAINKPIPSSGAGSAGKTLLEYALPTNGFPPHGVGEDTARRRCGIQGQRHRWPDAVQT